MSERATVAAVHLDGEHRFTKVPADEIKILAGFGVDGDAHSGVTVQHRSRVQRDPSQPNLRQVHLLQVELIDELAAGGFDVAPGALGENVTTSGVDLLSLPTGTRLRLGDDAELEVTGLRNPCRQLEQYQHGLQRAVLHRAPDGTLVRRAGVMAIALHDGVVRGGDPIEVRLPSGAPRPLAPV